MCYSFITKVKNKVFSLHLVDLGVSNYYVYLVQPFYFRKWNHYFSVWENLPNSSCHLGKHHSFLLQVLHQSLMRSNIILLNFFSSNIIYFGQKKLIKGQMFKTCEWSGQIVVSILKRQVNCSLNFASFLIVMTHNTSANVKLIHFLLWTKVSHQSPNYESFKSSGKNLPNSSCHFLN